MIYVRLSGSRCSVRWT